MVYGNLTIYMVHALATVTVMHGLTVDISPI